LLQVLYHPGRSHPGGRRTHVSLRPHWTLTAREGCRVRRTYTNAGSTERVSPARACRAAWAIGATVGEGSASRVATARVKGWPPSRCSSTSPGRSPAAHTRVSVPPWGSARRGVLDRAGAWRTTRTPV